MVRNGGQRSRLAVLDGARAYVEEKHLNVIVPNIIDHVFVARVGCDGRDGA